MNGTKNCDICYNLELFYHFEHTGVEQTHSEVFMKGLKLRLKWIVLNISWHLRKFFDTLYSVVYVNLSLLQMKNLFGIKVKNWRVTSKFYLTVSFCKVDSSHCNSKGDNLIIKRGHKKGRSHANGNGGKVPRGGPRAAVGKS